MIDFFSYVYHTVVVFLNVDYLSIWFFPLLALGLIGLVPIIIRNLITWR